ncbi:MAG: Fic family protein [Candidatus Melainabacteria bacterium]|nr:Fic family protein [Candidatus Melainabacteria bacterium]
MSKIDTFIQQKEGYKAFIPEPFPPKDLIKWDNNLISLLSQADMAIGKLNAINELVPDADFFILMYIKKEAAISSQIEGTQATLIDLIKAEAKLEDEKPPSDVGEVKNYVKAMNYGIKRLKSLPLSLRLIKEIHKELLHGVRGHHKLPGEFRRSQNWIGGATLQTAIFVPPTVPEMQKALNDLEKFIHDKSHGLPELIKTGIIHAQFETIHPFLDGNGRIGRLLITLYLINENILNKPLLYLSDYFNKYRTDYYNKLNEYRAKDGVSSWLKYFLEGVKIVSNEAVETALKISRLREEHMKKVSTFGRNAKTALALLNKLYSSPIVDAKLVGKFSGLFSRGNISSLIEKFTKAEILHEITGRSRYQRFIYRDYLKLFSREKL